MQHFLPFFLSVCLSFFRPSAPKHFFKKTRVWGQNSGIKADKCPEKLALDLSYIYIPNSGITCAVGGTFPGDQNHIFGPQGGLEVDSEGSGRVARQPKQASPALDSYGKRIPPCQNTIGQRKPILWAGPPVDNQHCHVVGIR